jgi:membrane protease YdiL (CAAX protease family)
MGHSDDATPARRDGALVRYLRESRGLATGFLFALPLLLVYEIGILVMGSRVINGASALLQALIAAMAPAGWGIAAFNGCVVLAAFAAVVRTQERGRRVWRPGLYTCMAGESCLHALVLLLLMGWIGSRGMSAVAAPALRALAGDGPLGENLLHGVVLSLGAGVYEEIFFRWLLLGGLVWFLTSGFGVSPQSAGSVALIVSALLFSLFHHLGPLGDQFSVMVVLARTAAGLFLGSLYLRRGLGIAIWAHALYDVAIVVVQHGLRP